MEEDPREETRANPTPTALDDFVERLARGEVSLFTDAQRKKMAQMHEFWMLYNHKKGAWPSERDFQKPLHHHESSKSEPATRK